MRRTLAALVLCALSLPAAAAERPDWSVVGFAGQITRNTTGEIVTFDDVGLRDAYLVGIGLTRRLHSWGALDIEAEGQVVRHLGNEDNWQFNAAIGPRWTAFPWNRAVPTSAAWLLGLSRATRVPTEEAVMHDSDARLLVYWLAEVELGLPAENWAAVLRIHHRSTGLGQVFEGGGSNWFVVGLRRGF